MLSVVAPRFILKHFLTRIRVVITYGDLQEYNQVDNAIGIVLPNTFRVRCGWHIVEHGFDKYVDTRFLNFPSPTLKK